MFARRGQNLVQGWWQAFWKGRLNSIVSVRSKFITVFAIVLASAAAFGVCRLILGGSEKKTDGALGAAFLTPKYLHDIALGVAEAPVTVIEYASLGCTHCAHFALNTLPQLREKYVATGKLRYIFRPFPLDARSTGAYMLTRCVAENRYYPLVDALFRQQELWARSGNPVESLIATVRFGGLSAADAKKCLADQQLLNDVTAVRRHAEQELDVSATPTFFINGHRYQGDLPFQELSAIIDGLL